MSEAYGSNATIIARVGADPETFGFESDTDLEDFLDTLRQQASSEIVEFCDRVFSLQTGETEIIHGTGRKTFQTRNYPVRDIQSIEIRGAELDSDHYQIQTPPGRPDTNSGLIERIGSRHRRRWPRGNEIEVVYDWGYEEPPSVVERVVEDMVVEALEKADADRQSSAKSSESMDGYSVSWDNSDVSDYLTLDESKRNRLKPLKRMGMA